MKKHQPGFVPINFKSVGKMLLVIGLGALILSLLAHFLNWFSVSFLVYLGGFLVILSLYLILVVPKE